MGRQDWVYPAIPKHLVNKIDNCLDQKRDRFGDKKYKSRQTFVVEAIKNLLIKEKVL